VGLSGRISESLQKGLTRWRPGGPPAYGELHPFWSALKLHAVAPGGPPEGHGNPEQRMVYDTPDNGDGPLETDRTLDPQIHDTVQHARSTSIIFE
jgi:hypothetical protein